MHNDVTEVLRYVYSAEQVSDDLHEIYRSHEGKAYKKRMGKTGDPWE